jgi:hypothetical protein
MKTWAEAAIVMEQHGQDSILKGFWPQLSSQEVIKRNSPIRRRKNDTTNVWENEEEKRTGGAKHLRKQEPNTKKECPN